MKTLIFSQNYILIMSVQAQEYTMPLYNQSEDVIIPAHGCVVLWAYWSDRYTMRLQK
jgi:hypothetical protein